MEKFKNEGTETKPITINLNEIETELKNSYKLELNQNIANILIEDEQIFLTKIHETILELFSTKYEMFQKLGIIKTAYEDSKKEFLKVYKNTKDSILFSLSEFEKKSKNEFLVSKYKRHCKQSSEYARHKCGGYLIKVINKQIFYIVCNKCKVCATSDCFDVNCPCETVIYSRVLKDEEDGNLMHATWQNYHCSSLTNEKMKCIKCKELIYYNLAEDVVMCKACGFKVEPTLIKWNCVYCKSTFRSKAKFHDDNDLSEFRKEVVNILRTKDIAKPENMSCDCKVNIEASTFFHKRECNGMLYKGIYQNKVVIVCSTCRTSNYSEYFLWTCPKCYKRFHSVYTNIANLLRTQSKSYTLKESNDKLQNDQEIKANIKKTPKTRDNSPVKCESQKILSQIVNDNSVENVEQGVVKPYNNDIISTPNASKAAPKFTKIDSGIYLTTINVNEKTEQKPIFKSEIKENLFNKPERNVVLI
jgi:hypothetical protein